ncbi:MAG: hypothetical protein GY725_21265 [bacterium]|nr:hypothetical protein [bacterium]
MAEETEETEATEEQEASEIIADEPAGAGKKKLILMGAAALVLVIASAGAGFLFFGEEPEEVAEAGPTPEQLAEQERQQRQRGVVDGVDYAAEVDVEVPMPEMDIASGDEEEDEAAAAPAENHMGKIVHLEPFVVNISDKDRDRYLKLKADIELSEDKVASEFDQRLPQMRDLIISLLGGKSFEDLRTIEGKNFLREEILLRVNALLVTGKAKRIFFTEFVVQ